MLPLKRMRKTSLMSRKSILLISFFLLLIPLVEVTTYVVTRLQSQDIRSRATDTSVINLSDGPHLFIDEYLIDLEQSRNIIRMVNKAEKFLSEPVIRSSEQAEIQDSGRGYLWIYGDAPIRGRNFDWDSEVHFDNEKNIYRLWFESYDLNDYERYTAYAESPDAFNWTLPYYLRDGEVTRYISNAIIDEGLNYSPSDQRYKMVSTGREEGDRQWYGLGVFSADGINWGSPTEITDRAYGETWTPYWDSKFGQYGLLHRWNITPQDAGQWGIPVTEWTRSIGHIESPDFDFRDNPSHPIFAPNYPKEGIQRDDFGITQFYHMSNPLRRGDLLIATLAILRDDLKADDVPPTQYYSWTKVKDSNGNLISKPQEGPTYGIGYTVLAWSRDGELYNGQRLWHRNQVLDEYTNGKPGYPASYTGARVAQYVLDHRGLAADPNVFLAPSTKFGDYDYAHAWGSAILPIVDQDGNAWNYLYYAGYQYSHKTYVDRSLGLARVKQDRFVSRKSRGNAPGRLVTPLIQFDADSLYLNVDAAPEGFSGWIETRILDEQGNELLRGPRLSEIDEVHIDSGLDLTDFNNKPVMVEFTLKDANLFAFYLEDSEEEAKPRCLEQKKTGDFDCNGVVNYRDFEAWQNDYLKGKTTLSFFEYWRRVFFRE